MPHARARLLTVSFLPLSCGRPRHVSSARALARLDATVPSTTLARPGPGAVPSPRRRHSLRLFLLTTVQGLLQFARPRASICVHGRRCGLKWGFVGSSVPSPRQGPPTLPATSPMYFNEPSPARGTQQSPTRGRRCTWTYQFFGHTHIFAHPLRHPSRTLRLAGDWRIFIGPRGARIGPRAH